MIEGEQPDFEDVWYEKCTYCNGKGLKDDKICAECEGRCFVPHDCDD